MTLLWTAMVVLVVLIVALSIVYRFGPKRASKAERAEKQAMAEADIRRHR
jgi:hypothetical protein